VDILDDAVVEIRKINADAIDVLSLHCFYSSLEEIMFIV
jgi:hypothetical protein